MFFFVFNLFPRNTGRRGMERVPPSSPPVFFVLIWGWWWCCSIWLALISLLEAVRVQPGPGSPRTRRWAHAPRGRAGSRAAPTASSRGGCSPSLGPFFLSKWKEFGFSHSTNREPEGGESSEEEGRVMEGPGPPETPNRSQPG